MILEGRRMERIGQIECFAMVKFEWGNRTNFENFLELRPANVAEFLFHALG
jgi:hypothetical protein